MSKEYDHLFKVLLCGESETGKSAFLIRSVKGTFNEKYHPTIGVEFATQTIEYKSQKIKLQIWDTAGQERFMSLSSAYFKGAAGVFVVYNVTNKATFNSVEKHFNQAKEMCSHDTVFILMGCFSDQNDKRQVTYQEGCDKANKLGIAFIEVSNKGGENTKEALNLMTEYMFNMKDTGQAKVVSAALHSSEEKKGEEMKKESENKEESKAKIFFMQK